MQHQLRVFQSMQKTGMDDMHQMRKIESPVGALGPPSVAAEELASAAVPQKSFNRILEIHDLNIPKMRKNRYGVKHLNFMEFRFIIIPFRIISGRAPNSRQS
jgi:hypothetical protein